MSTQHTDFGFANHWRTVEDMPAVVQQCRSQAHVCKEVCVTPTGSDISVTCNMCNYTYHRDAS